MTHNELEYKAMLVELWFTTSLEVRHIATLFDSHFILNQVKGSDEQRD